MARLTISTPICSSPSSLKSFRRAMLRTSATPPPGTMPSSTAARVAYIASSTRAFADHRDAADELGQALLELLAVVVRGGVLDLAADRLDPGVDRFLLARAL